MTIQPFSGRGRVPNRTLRGMRQLLTAIALIALGLGLTACGGDDNEASPEEAFASAMTDGVPQCSDVWVEGETLPEDYEGCLHGDDTLVPTLVWNCKDDESKEWTNYQNEDEPGSDTFIAVFGGTIENSDQYRNEYFDGCNGQEDSSAEPDASAETEEADTEELPEDGRPTFDNAYAIGAESSCRYLDNKPADKPATSSADCKIEGVPYEVHTFADNDQRDKWLAMAAGMADAFEATYDALVGDNFIVLPGDMDSLASVDYSTFEESFGGEIQQVGGEN